MTVRRIALLLAVALLAVPLAACGHKEKVVTSADTEGTYLTVGNLDYQVQISRELNPADAEDRGYLVGLSPGDAQLGPDEAWFGVFMGVWNYSKHPGQAASDFVITDTQHNTYRPVAIGPTNVFAWRPQVVPSGSQLPPPDTAAQNNPSVNGGLVLFKIKLTSFANRPLVLAIHGPAGAQPPTATVDLDV